MQITAKAPANIAFIKYWGKKDEKLRLPLNSSISMNLSDVFTVTSVEFSDLLKKDLLKIDGKTIEGKEKERVTQHLDRIRKLAGIKAKADVESQNNFPKGTGLASSASGFAALTMAASYAAGLFLSERQLSILARVGSGSACRSIPGGFVEWRAGDSSKTSYAYSLYAADYWDICDVIAIVGEASKKVSSTEGHVLAESSPFFKARINGMRKKVLEIKKTLKDKDFTKFGEILEAEAINMHAVMMTSKPALYYWTPETTRLILSLINWRDKGLESYFTIDAGPNVHVICKGRDVTKVRLRLKNLPGVRKVIVNRPARGTHTIVDVQNDRGAIVLVDKNDKAVGLEEKFEAHKNPAPLHRAISVVIFDKSGKKMLLQKRAKGKPTWPLFWSNACCTHPYKEESYEECAKRRLKEEMGFSVPLKELFRFVYKEKYDKTWGEHEYDVVFAGNYEGKVNPNPNEIADWKWVEMDKLSKDVKVNPEIYTPWFKILLKRLFV